MKRILLLMLVLALLPLSGCRVRTTADHADSAAQAGHLAADGSGESGDGSADGNRPRGALPERPGESDVWITEAPDAHRREYDENASALIVPGAPHRLHESGEGSGAADPGERGPSAELADDSADRTATQALPAAGAERKSAAEDADDADSFLTYYTVLLEDRLGSIFECQRRDLYWETPQELRTIHKTSPEHQWILQAGCYDVSARLLEENLTVDPGWVQRKDPGVIVKVVDGAVLGRGVTDRGAAQAVLQSLTARPGWSDIDAVRNGRIVLVSEQLLASRHLRTAMLVAVASAAFPDLFADTDPAEALRSLSQEEAGAPAEGEFFCFGE